MTDTMAEPKPVAVADELPPLSTMVNRRRVSSSDTAVVTADGDLDASHIPVLRQKIARALGSLDEGSVILDLRSVEFLSLSVACELVEIKHRAAPRGLDLRLVFHHPAVQRALDVTGAFLLFPAYPSIEAAAERRLPA
ncbi:STAS domain-containing protein [Nocardia sp. CS682]|uniref:STAS domain-containing protein n=1 Tax=Nocardia sp. CS682 TaxID=1047172 RepID=UPI001074DBC3|nr:STAS domain-containing protein [Nocardia sp. CS682]QBS39280.1 anti-sigma factor antagonist [Nocardia sp. CS682]